MWAAAPAAMIVGAVSPPDREPHRHAPHRQPPRVPGGGREPHDVARRRGRGARPQIERGHGAGLDLDDETVADVPGRRGDLHRPGCVQGQEPEAVDLRHAGVGRRERHRDVRPHRADGVDHLDRDTRSRADVVLGRRVGEREPRHRRGRHRHRHLDLHSRVGAPVAAARIGGHEGHEGELAGPVRLDLTAARHPDAAPRAGEIDDRRVLHHRAVRVPDGGGQRRRLADREGQAIRSDLERERPRHGLRRRRPRRGGERRNADEQRRRASDVCHEPLPHRSARIPERPRIAILRPRRSVRSSPPSRRKPSHCKPAAGPLTETPVDAVRARAPSDRGARRHNGPERPTAANRKRGDAGRYSTFGMLPTCGILRTHAPRGES